MNLNCIITVPGFTTRCIQVDGGLDERIEDDRDLHSNGKYSLHLKNSIFYELIGKYYPLSRVEDYYLIVNNRILSNLEGEGYDYGCDGDSYVNVSLLFRLPGGKGGFGAIIKSQGAKKKQSTNVDSCRNLSGQRIRTARLSDKMKEWQDRQRDVLSKDPEILKLPKKELENHEPPKVGINQGLDERRMKQLKKDVKKVKYSVLRGLDELRAKESIKLQEQELEERKREMLLEQCLDVYDL